MPEAPAPALLPEDEMLRASCLAELWRGNAQPLIEEYFRIKDVDGNLVPMIFLPLQMKYQQLAFGGGWKPGMSREITMLKARKATASAWAIATEAANFFFNPGWDIAVIADAEKTLTPLSNMVNTFYENLPPHMKPAVYNQKWGTEERQVVFRDERTGKTVINTMVMSSSKSPNFGRGYTIKMAHLDELSRFDESFDEAAMQNSVGGGVIWARVSTANGHDRFYYPAVQKAKAHATPSQVYSFFEWWWNDENAYTEDSEDRRSEDDGILTPGVGEGLPPDLFKDEPFIVAKFPPGRSVSDRLRFRRRKLLDSWLQNSHDTSAALSRFFEDYPEDDVTCFENLTNAQFDRLIMSERVQEAETARIVRTESYSGLLFRAWEGVKPGHSYGLSLDLGGSEKESSDPSSLQIKDLSAATYMAEMHGRQETRFVIQKSCDLARFFNTGVLIIDTTGLGNAMANWAAGYKQLAGDGLGYPNVWRRERLPGEDVTLPLYRNRDYGFKITPTARMAMLRDGRENFNTAAIRHILNLDLLSDMRAYNPDGTNEGMHFPDRVSAFFQMETVNPQPASGGLYAPEGRVKQRWLTPPTAATPFAA